MESSLTIPKSQFEARLGYDFGYGRGALYGEAAWTTTQKNDIKDCLDSGVRRVYFPKLSNGEQYSWNFLRPTRSLVLHTGLQAAPLPDDFGGLDEDKITVSVAGSNSVFWVLLPTNPEKVRILYAADPAASGQPTMAAVQTLEGVRNDGSNRKQLAVFPAADQDYTLTFAMYLRPEVLSNDYPYAYGGPELSELILASCLAYLEEAKDNMRGVHNAAYEELLAAAISGDRRTRPQNYGRNTDRSEGRHVVTRRGARGYEYVIQAEGIVSTSALTGGS